MSNIKKLKSLLEEVKKTHTKIGEQIKEIENEIELLSEMSNEEDGGGGNNPEPPDIP